MARTINASSQPLAWLKPAVFAGSLVPLASLIIRWRQGALEADPVAEVLNKLGLAALVFLVASLACTPLKILFKWIWPIRLRKMLGLFAFFYAFLHFSVYVGIDQGFSFRQIFNDLIKNKFIIFGFSAFVLLIPLAITSTSGMIRRLGAKRWKMLHKLVYVAGILGVLHFIWRVKVDISEPLIYGGVLGLLLGIRLIAAARMKSGHAVTKPK